MHPSAPTYDGELVRRVRERITGRADEIVGIVAALRAARHLVLEGPPGTGKSTLLRRLSECAGVGLTFVEGNAELTPARLIGWHDPSRLLRDGYSAAAFVAGPLAAAMRDGGVLYVEELNRIPEETLNVLVTVMSEGELSLPRIERITAAPGFRLVAAMNPFDAVGTSRIAAAIADRMCRIVVSYQNAAEEAAIVAQFAPAVPADLTAAIVALVQATRDHPELRAGSSVRGAIDLALLAESFADVRGADVRAPQVLLEAALAALSGRIRVDELCERSAEAIVTELVQRYLRADRAPPNGVPAPAPGPANSAQRDAVPGFARFLAAERRHTWSRAELAQYPSFLEISPEPGAFDAQAFARVVGDDPNKLLATLPRLLKAADRRLARAVRGIAARVALRHVRLAVGRGGSDGRRALARGAFTGELDIDAIVRVRAGIATADEFMFRIWQPPRIAFCLIVDTSGSMSGDRLGSAALAPRHWPCAPAAITA
jgi:MoxR-like ATPase